MPPLLRNNSHACSFKAQLYFKNLLSLKGLSLKKNQKIVQEKGQNCFSTKGPINSLSIMCQRPEPAFQRGSEASTCTLRAIKGCKQHDDYLMGDIFIGSLGKRRDGLEMAVINVHPSPAEMAGKQVVDGPGNQNPQGKEGWEEEVMKAEGF